MRLEIDPQEGQFRHMFWRFVVPMFAIAAVFLSYQFVREFLHLDFLSEEGLQDMRMRLMAFGIWTPVAFCLLYGTRGVFYIPEPILMTMAGFLFGPIYAVGLIVIGSLLAASVAYGFVRLLMSIGKRSFLERFLELKPGRLQRLADRFGFRTLLIWRMLPTFPFSFFTYTAAFLRFDFGRYLLAMGCGVIVPATLYATIGSLLSN